MTPIRGVPVTAALRQKPTEACIRRLCQLTLCPIPFRGIPAYPLQQLDHLL